MKIKKIIMTIVCLMMVTFLGTNNAYADTVDDATGIIGGIAMYKMSETGARSVQEWADGAIREGAGTDGDSFAYALYKLGLADVSSYCDALEKYVTGNAVRSASTRLKYALCMCMKDPAHEYVKKTLEDSIGQLGIMSFVFGQHLANNGAVGQTYSPEQIALEILSMQHPDGGWSVMGQNGDVDVTAMVLQALSGVGAGSGGSGNISRPASIEIAIDRGIRFLSDRQNPDGGFSGFGNENAESTAQVMIALSSLGIDPAGDARFIKNGNTVLDGIKKYALPDGSFEHIVGGGSDSSATGQVFSALVSYICYKEGDIYYLLGSPRKESLIDIVALEAAGAEGSAQDDVRVSAHNDADAAEQAAQPDEEGTAKDDARVFAQPGAETFVQADAGDDAEDDNIKAILLLGVLGLAMIACVLLLMFKKRNPKNFLFVLTVAGVAAVFVFLSDFKTESAYYTADYTVEDAVGEVTVTIRCDTIAGEEGAGHIPGDGIILDTTTYEFGEGDSVYDILVRAVRENKIHMEKKKTGSGPEDYYICGIANIYEYDWGELSGWMYYVNGESPSVGCGAYKVRPGDRIEWLYTREIGRDLGKVLTDPTGQ